MGRISPATLLISGSAITAVAYGVLYGTSRAFRTFVRTANPRSLTLLQTSRTVGAVLFGRKYMAGEIPARYGLTTALCDLFVGTTAPLVVRFGSRHALEQWNWLGLAALMISGGSGMLSSLTWLDTITGRKTSQPTTSFPLVLVPTLFGPATLLAHLMALSSTAARKNSD